MYGLRWYGEIALKVLTTNLARMEACLDRCATSPGDSIENKVQILCFYSDKSLPEVESFAWLGRSILDTKALLRSLESGPDNADQKITEFIKSWCGEDYMNFPAWKGTSKTEQLQQMMELFCAGLEGFCDGIVDESEIGKCFHGDERNCFLGQHLSDRPRYDARQKVNM